MEITMYPTINSSIKLSPLGNELVVFTPSTDQTHTLAPVAAAVLNACDGTRDVPALAAVAQAVDDSVSESQVWGLLDHFGSAGFLDNLTVPTAALTPAVGRRGWMRSVMGGGAAVAATVLATRNASAKKNDEEEEDAFCKPDDGKQIDTKVNKVLEYERQMTFRHEAAQKASSSPKREALIGKISSPVERRRKLGQEQNRKRQHLLLDAGDGTAAWLALPSGPVLEMTLAPGTGSLLPIDSNPVPLTLTLTTVFDEAAADDVAARADLVKSNAELEKEIKEQGDKVSPKLLAAEVKVKKALSAPGVSAAAHAEDMAQIAELIAKSAFSAQTVTLALGAQALIVGDLEVLGGETESVSSGPTGDSASDLVRLLVRLPDGAAPMLVGFDELIACVDQKGIAGELSGNSIGGSGLVANLTVRGSLDVAGKL
jgi:hypothetical protein